MTEATLNSGAVPEIKRHGGRRPGAGRPPTQFRDGVARETGMSPRTQRRAEEHVRLVELYGLPHDSSQSTVLRIGTILAKLPEDQRRAALALVRKPQEAHLEAAGPLVSPSPDRAGMPPCRCAVCQEERSRGERP